MKYNDTIEAMMIAYPRLFLEEVDVAVEGKVERDLMLEYNETGGNDIFAALETLKKNNEWHNIRFHDGLGKFDCHLPIYWPE